MDKLPNFIIIGAMKCATSTLHEQLAAQPGIFMSQLKEPNFFSDNEQYAKGEGWYASHFALAQSQDIRGESSTHYTKLPTYPLTVERLQKCLPNVKIIYIMRDPVKRLVSQYIHEWTQKVISVDINEAIYKHNELIDYSRYSFQLKPYIEAFGQNNILPIFFEKLIQEPQTELERVCRFIGYADTPKWDEELEAQNISSQRLRKSEWRDLLVELPVLKEVRQNWIPKSTRDWVKSWWTMKNKPELEPEQLSYLHSVFNEDLTILGYWFGIALSCDNFQSKVLAESIDWRN